MKLKRLVFVLIAAVIGLALISWLFPFANLGADDRAQIFYQLTLIFLLLSSAVLAFSGNMTGMLKYAVWWVLIFLVLVAGYSYKPQFIALKDTIIAQFVPYHPIEREQGTLAFRKSNDGHFYIKADVNGTPVLFLLDTGASSIVLAPGDAKRAGYVLSELVFDQIYNTANGKGTGASVRIRDFQLGGLTLHNMPASVNGAEMDTSLLGMRFLESVKSYAVEGDELVIHY